MEKKSAVKKSELLKNNKFTSKFMLFTALKTNTQIFHTGLTKSFIIGPFCNNGSFRNMSLATRCNQFSRVLYSLNPQFSPVFIAQIGNWKRQIKFQKTFLLVHGVVLQVMAKNGIKLPLKII